MKSLHNLFDKTTLAAIEQDRQIRLLISRIVPASTLSHIQYCRLDAGRLRVTVDNANWIARLRFNERQIVDALRENGLDAITLSCHVAPAERPTSPSATRTRRMPSAESAAVLERLANEVTPAEDDAVTNSDAGESVATSNDSEISHHRHSPIADGSKSLEHQLRRMARQLRGKQ